ncbi:fimbrial protein [Cronobacter universalis]|uniref:F4 family fimbrial subunit n=1 Tax=Cronobacter universalis TaxID=535744 RepID=UPI003CF48E91
MKMKKTLIALALATSAASSAAHAWQQGDFTGSVELGGNITAEDLRNKWSWQVGSGLNNFDHTMADMTENGKKLVIRVSGDKSLVAGKTNVAFAAPVAGGVGAIPHIALTDYEGNSVSFTQKGEDGSRTNLGFITLPMKDAEGNKLGQATIQVTYGAFAGVAGGPQVNESGLRALYAINTNSIFYGGFPSDLSGGESTDAAATAMKVSKLGGLSAADALAQIQAVNPSVTTLSPHNSSGTENMKYTNGNVVSASYALGIANNNPIELEFTNSVRSSTTWNVPLNVAVTYN